MDAIRRVYNDHPKTVLFSAAAVLRILLAVTFPGLPDLLTGRVEISTPVTSFKRLQEGLFLYERGLDPYDGGIFHQAPLLLPLFALLPSPAPWLGRIVSVMLFTGLDILSADSLFDIAESRAAPSSSAYTSSRQERSWGSASVASLFLFNPLTILSCLGRPTSTFTAAFVLLSIKHACQAEATTSAFALAMASYISLHPMFLLPPVGMLCYDQACQQIKSRQTNPQEPVSKNVSIDQRSLPHPATYAAQILTSFTTAIGFLFLLSRILLPSWQFIPSVYLTPLQLPDLTPNPGLWWYFFVEMFDAFRSFFLGVFWLHMLAYSWPLCLRLRKQPLAATVLMMGITSIFEPYANIGAAALWLSSLCLLGHAFELSSLYRYSFPALAAILYCTLLGPAFHHLWIYAGSGNANFFYAITLVWNLAQLILLTDALYAVLRDEWESERPEGKGQEVRQI